MSNILTYIKEVKPTKKVDFDTIYGKSIDIFLPKFIPKTSFLFDIEIGKSITRTFLKKQIKRHGRN